MFFTAELSFVMYNLNLIQKGWFYMNIADIRFPIEGNVQNLVHFSDYGGNYVFTFGSPFCYAGPEELKNKKAFILGGFNHLKKKSLDAESVYTYYIPSDEKKKHPDPSVKASVRKAEIFGADHTLSGRIEILVQNGVFRKYAGLHPNPVYSPDGTLIAFCRYSPKNKSKDLFTCLPDFAHLSESLTDEQISDFIAEGTISRVFSYDIVEAEDVDQKDRFMSIFSPSKKSELTNNRIRFFGFDGDKKQLDLLLTALFAFFWITYIDIPMN